MQKGRGAVTPRRHPLHAKINLLLNERDYFCNKAFPLRVNLYSDEADQLRGSGQAEGILNSRRGGLVVTRNEKIGETEGRAQGIDDSGSRIGHERYTEVGHGG